jgi:Protein of unknown function (DUF2490)
MKLIHLFIFCYFAEICFAQNNRQNDFNNINWVQLFINKKIGKKTEALIEYQWRRTDGLRNGQQGLFRTALQYKPTDQVSFGVGYAEVETYVYGNFPIASLGRFPEHRLFEQAIVKQKINDFTITNRLRIEQRWLGRIKLGSNREIEEWVFLHRFRYLIKIQKPIYKNIYGWLGDELFIGAGKNIGVNVFDQNRVHINLGYKINNNSTIEFGYINQVLQQGRLINNKSIFQRNSGLLLSTSINF